MQSLSPAEIAKDLTFFQAKAGDQRAIRKVIETWTPLLHKMANKYGWLAAPHQRDDLLQHGRIAIVKAIETYNPDSAAKPATWIFYQVRGAISQFSNSQKKHPRFPIDLETADRNGNLADPSVYEVSTDYPKDFVKKIIEAGCRDGLGSRRAQIVCSRFGLLGQEALPQGEVAKKFGLSKQAVNGHLVGFYKRVQKQMPEAAKFLG